MSKSTKKLYSKEQEIYWQMEPSFLFDYTNFANKLRYMQALESTHTNFTMQQDGKRMALVLLTENYQKSLEDLSVVVLSLYRRFNADKDCGYQKKFKVAETPLPYTVINYDSKEADLTQILKLMPTQAELVQKIKLDDITRINIELIYPTFDRRNFFSDFYKDLNAWAKDQSKRFKIYNKIKHGLAVLGSARALGSDQPNDPAVVYCEENENLTDFPLIVHTLKYTESEFVLLQWGIKKISERIRQLLNIYLCKNYPEKLISYGYKPPLSVFRETKPKN